MTLSKELYRETLAAIERANKNLREMTQHNISREPSRRQRNVRLIWLSYIKSHAHIKILVLAVD